MRKGYRLGRFINCPAELLEVGLVGATLMGIALCRLLKSEIGKSPKAVAYTQVPRRRPIFPGRHHPSIVGAGAFHFRVRDGNEWVHPARATRERHHYIIVDESSARDSENC